MMNKYPNNLGWHVPLAEVNRYLDDSLTFQVTVTDPVTYNLPLLAAFKRLRYLWESGVRIVVHAPYLTNICRGNQLTFDFTCQYCEHFYRGLKAAGIPPLPLVVHTGKSNKTESLDVVSRRMADNFKILKNRMLGLDCQICFETDASPSPLTRLDALVQMLDYLAPGDTNFGVCFDTEHSFASGFKVSEISPTLWGRIRVVHLNSIPSKVRFGSGLDRHSDVPLDESQEQGFDIPIFQEALHRDLPVILERDVTFVWQDIKRLSKVTI